MAGRDGGITKKCEKISIWAAGGGDQLASVLIASAPGRSQVAGGVQGRYCYNFITGTGRLGDWPSLCGKTAIIVSRQTLQALLSVLGNVRGNLLK